MKFKIHEKVFIIHPQYHNEVIPATVVGCKYYEYCKDRYEVSLQSGTRINTNEELLFKNEDEALEELRPMLDRLKEERIDDIKDRIQVLKKDLLWNKNLLKEEMEINN